MIDRRRFLFIASGLLFQLGSLQSIAGPPVELTISQGFFTGTEIILQASVVDESGAAVADIAAGAFSATVGAEAARVESVDFAPNDQGVGYILLVDVSKSVTREQFETMKIALNEWVAGMRDIDQMALMEFGEGVRTLLPFTGDKDSMNSAIGELARSDNKTFLFQAMVQALSMGRRELAEVPPRRVIILLTDGLDDVAGGVTEQEVLTAMSEGNAPIYAIGFSHPGQDNEQGFDTLGRISRLSGGAFVNGMTSTLDAAYDEIHQLVNEQYRIHLVCEACVMDGGVYPVQLVVRWEGAVLRATTDLRLFPTLQVASADEAAPEPTAGPADNEPAAEGNADVAAEQASPSAAPLAWWLKPNVLGVAGLLILLLAFLGLRLRRKGSQEPEPRAEESEVHPPSPFPPASSEEDSYLATHTQSQSVDFARPPRPRIRLTSIRGGQHCSLALPAELGRSAESHWVLPDDDTISGKHARIVERGSKILLEDLGSTNGTFLNGVRVHGANPLHDRDLIRLGEFEFRVQILGEQ